MSQYSDVSRRLGAALFALALLCFPARQAAAVSKSTTATMSTPAFRAYPVEVKVEKLADGLVFPEGPVWLPRQNRLVFSDVHDSKILALRPDGAGVEEWLSLPGEKTNGIITTPGGQRLLACGHGSLSLLDIDPETRTTTTIVAEAAPGQPFVNVNDVAVTADSTIFFTDPDFSNNPAKVQGVYSVTGWRGPGSKPTVQLAAALGPQPNGLVVTPDGGRLLVARSGAHDVVQFDIEPGGVLSHQRPFCTLGAGANPDGMTIDAQGYVFQTQYGFGRVAVLSPEGGLLGEIPVAPAATTNCEFDPASGGRLLYVTSAGDPKKRIGALWKVTLPETAAATAARQPR